VPPAIPDGADHPTPQRRANLSFFDYESYQILIPAFSLQYYIDVFTDATTWATYLSTLKFCLIV
jgi:hypothetical protein